MNLKPIITLLSILSILSNGVYAQIDGDVFRPSNAPVVKGYNGMQKISAWCGGVNTPQISVADLNNDGIKDVVIYEAPYKAIKTFIGLGGRSYEYDGFYEQFFPKNNKFFLKLIDYNRDNIPDVATGGLTSSMALYKGYYDNNVLKFKFYKDLRYDDPNSPHTIGLYSPPNAIPGVEDVDGDEDIDFVAYNVFPEFWLAYYRNCEKEDVLPSDTVKICLKTMCWSGSAHYDGQKTHGLQANCDGYLTTCKPSKATDGITNLCLLDYDGDGDMDYMSCHSAFDDIQLLINGKADYGATKDSIVSQQTSWTTNGHTIKMDISPTAFWVDIDNDNDKDIIVTPQSVGAENYKCVQLIENTGSDANPNFNYRYDTLLVEDMIDVGEASFPVLYDYDRDGKKDLFIGSDGYYAGAGNFISKIAYYKNTSSNTAVSFELQTEDFLNLSTQNFVGTAIAFGDLDNDSLDDMVVGRRDGTFAFFKNSAASHNDQPIWNLQHAVLADMFSFPMDVGDNATPFIYDINRDGLNDLISGNLLGDIYYYECKSATSGTITVDLKTKNLGGIKIEDNNIPGGYTAPYIGPVDDSEKDYLVVGTYWGTLYRYDSINSGNIQNLPMLDSNYSYIDVHIRAAPFFGNINNSADKLYELVVGNQLGGLNYYKQDFPVSIDSKLGQQADVNIYPNPAKDKLYIKWNGFADGETVHVSLVSITGQQIVQLEFNSEDLVGEIHLDKLVSGMYYCIVKASGERVVTPVSVLK